MKQTERQIDHPQPLRLGFPTVAGNGTGHFVWVSKRRRKENEPHFSVTYYGNTNGPLNLNNEAPLDSGTDAIQDFLDLLDASSEHVTFWFQDEGGYETALKRRPDNNSVSISVEGGSNALALAMVCIAEQVEEHDAGTPGLLVSCSRNVTDPKGPRALQNNTGLKHKIDAVIAFPHARVCLALHPNNLNGGSTATSTDFLNSELTSNQFIAIDVSDNNLWATAKRLLTEFRIPYHENAEPQQAESDTGPSLSRVDLLRAALPTALIGNLELLSPLPKHFSTDALQPIQKLALDNAQDVFANLNVGNNLKDLIISGPAGCGKTALTEALMLNGIFERLGGCIYLAPTRSLAYEVHRRFRDTFGFLWGSDDQRDERIIVSTGERGESDWRIQAGHYDLACLVSEKGNVLLDVKDSQFLHSATLLIVDELHMIGDPTRGGVVDLLLTKFRAEQLRRRGAGELRPLQIVGVSTEGLGERILKLWALLDDAHPPLPLSVTSRTVAVAHKVVAYGIEGAIKWKEIDLLDEPFEHQHQRTIQVGSKEFADRVTFLSNQVAKLKPLKQPDRTFFRDYLSEMRKIHQTVLFAYGSKDRLRDIAKQLRNSLKDTDYSKSTWWAGFKDMVANSDETKNAKDLRLDWARRGVFVHDADTPEILRRWVEDTFSKPDSIGSDHAIILCTETLTYGVNLSASAVVIGGLKFPRDVSDELRDLDGNQFHNLMGRAGRLGFQTETTPVATVCIPINEISPNSPRTIPFWRDILKRYYTSANDIESASALFARADIEETKNRLALARGPAAKRLEATIERPTLERIQPPSFRAVIDALHHLGGSEVAISRTQIARFLDRTIYNGTCPETDVEATQQLATDTLDAAVKFSDLNAVRLVDGDSSGGYRVKRAAKALIDTGTQLSAVRPLAAWLTVLRDLGGQTDYLQPELIIPGLILTPEYWNTARKLCSEGNLTREIDAKYAGKSEIRSERLLEDEYSKIGQDSLDWGQFRTLMKAHLHDYSDSLKHESNKEFKWCIFAKLTAMALAWLRGQGAETIVAMYDKTDDESEEGDRPPAFHARYAERLSWLSVMTHRFFGDAGGQLPASLERDLPTLTRRLRVGLPPAGLPFLGAFGVAESQRANIVAAVAAGVRPRSFLLPNESQLVVEALRQRFRNLVRGFYRSETERIRLAIGMPGEEPDTEMYVVMIAKLIEELLKSKHPFTKNHEDAFHGIKDSLRKGMDDCIAALQTAYSAGHRDFTVNTVVGSIRHDNTLIYFLTRDNQLLPANMVGIRVGLPWYSKPEADLAQDVAHVSTLGASVSLALVARGLLSWTELRRTVEVYRGKPLSLRAIVAAALTPDLRNMGPLMNTLLQFEEPGIL